MSAARGAWTGWLFATALLVACGGESRSDGAPGNGDGGAPVGGGTGGRDTGGSGGADTTGSGGQPVAVCAALSDAIGAETMGENCCTTTVRLDHSTSAILGFQIACGTYQPPDEDAARQTAEVATGYGLNAALLSGTDPIDVHVFYQWPGDFGGVGVVSARSGLATFGGSIIWSGHGQITYPTSWRPAEELGSGCAPQTSTPRPPVRGLDLSGGQGSYLDTDAVAAFEVVWSTALIDGLAQGHYLHSAMVLLYAPSVGMFDPAVAEWIVLLNSEWLE